MVRQTKRGKKKKFIFTAIVSLNEIIFTRLTRDEKKAFEKLLLKILFGYEFSLVGDKTIINDGRTVENENTNVL